jgi:predicted metalloprotease with PDZ domain
MKPLLLTLAVLALPAGAQENRDDLTPLAIRYTTGLSDDLGKFRVRIEIEHVARPILHLAMPAWMPGAYFLGEFGQNVEGLTVRDGSGQERPVTRMDKGRWSVDSAGASRLDVAYEISAARRRRFGGRRPQEEEREVTGRSINGPATYLYVVGAKDLPVESRYELPEGWRVANGLLTDGDPLVRRARDYDTFIDAPTILGLFEERHFEVAGTPFHCVFFENEQGYDFDLDAFTGIVQRVSENIGQLYGSFPFPYYVYLFTIPGGGGLEHLNSTSIGLSAERQRDDPRAGASVVSHEFFHTWNVKRIRPAVLGPFEYQRENYTGNLWVSEGWTSYFGDLTLARTGVWSRDEYLEHLQGIIAGELNKPRRLDHSVTWASRNVWHRFDNEDEGARVDYYDMGELLGLLIDLEMRHATGDGKSLNDVMRFLNRWFAENDVGFQENDVERACTAVSNHDFREFFARHVHGTIDPPVAEILAHAGIAYSEEHIQSSFPFRLRGSRVAGRPSEEDAQQEGPRPGETIVSVDGQPFENANAVLRQHEPGDSVHLVLERGDEQREVDVVLGDEGVMIPTLRWDPEASPEQLALRERWLTSVE